MDNLFISHSSKDDEFVRNVALMNMSEIELSRMALGKVSSPEIKPSMSANCPPSQIEMEARTKWCAGRFCAWIERTRTSIPGGDSINVSPTLT